MNLEERPMSEFIAKKAKDGTVRRNMHDYPEAQLEYQFRLQVGSLPTAAESAASQRQPPCST